MATPVLYLIVRLGGDRYALEATQAVEVIPLVRLKALPGAPTGAAGLMNYRGTAVPVVDLNLLATGAPTPATEGARIIVVHLPAENASGDGDTLGLLVPEARERARLDPESFADAGLATDGARFLGPVLATPDGVLQRVTVRALLSDELRGALHRATEAA